MAPTMVSGQVRTKGTQGVASDRLVVDMQKKLYMYDSGANPALRALTMRSAMVPVKSTEPKWLQNEPVPEWDVTTAQSLAADTTLDATGAYHKAGDIIHVPTTNEYMLFG